jgi:hypothetical protein
LILPAFVVPESVIEQNGASEALQISSSGGSILVTVGILEVVEQESLRLGIYLSADAEAWEPQPAVEFPEKFYKGVSAVVLDVAVHPDARFMRAQWKVNRWGRGDKKPHFRCYLFAESL